MSIRTLLLEEHSKQQARKIVDHIGKNETRFRELITLFLANEPRITQRSAWPLGICAQEQPELIKPYLGDLVAMLEKKAVHDAVPRNVIRILQFMAIPEELHGRVMDKCFEYILSHTTPVAIKAFSLTVLSNMAKHYPEIKPELKLVIEERMEHETAAFASRARKILKEINRSSTASR